jgi:hypothetical protein
MLATYNPLTTVVLSGAALLLGLPVAVMAIIFEKVTMPDIVLGNKEIDIGPKGTKTITWNLLSGPNDAVFAAAYISMISALLLVGGLTVVRHVGRHNIWGWLVFLPGLANVLGQIGCCAYVFVVSSQHPEAISRNELKYVNGNYDANGKIYTRESWACSMKAFYQDQEPWSDKACSSFVCTVLRKSIRILIKSRKPVESQLFLSWVALRACLALHSGKFGSVAGWVGFLVGAVKSLLRTRRKDNISICKRRTVTKEAQL